MKRVVIIGIGTGHPDHVTVQGIKALNEADVLFVMDKGSDTEDLVRIRKEICAHHITNSSYRFVEVTDPERDRTSPEYRAAVETWHEQRADVYERLIRDELGDDECGAFLAWGDPSLYDSTLRIVEQVAARGSVTFEYEVIPGVSSVHVLAARHRIPLNRIGESVHVTTGRNLVHGLPDGVENVVVMLDGDCAFTKVDLPDADIYWGAYLGTDDEILVSGKLADVADEIVRVRDEARARKGWIMDTYLIRGATPTRSPR
ncbi:MAG TPA: precorrin-6A synthase (deacetylating) [Acidimicrobiia bacterium]